MVLFGHTDVGECCLWSLPCVGKQGRNFSCSISVQKLAENECLIYSVFRFQLGLRNSGKRARYARSTFHECLSDMIPRWITRASLSGIWTHQCRRPVATSRNPSGDLNYHPIWLICVIQLQPSWPKSPFCSFWCSGTTMLVYYLSTNHLGWLVMIGLSLSP